jgi:hypothetical protein
MLYLGIIISPTNNLLNHRSLFKVLCNPFFRLFGFQVATLFCKSKMKKRNSVFIKCKREKRLNFSFDYVLGENLIIKKYRII